MSSLFKEKKRVCWCTPSCGKVLGSSQRRKHYNASHPDIVRDSETEDESDQGGKEDVDIIKYFF